MQAIIDWPSRRNIFEERRFHGLDRQPFQWIAEDERIFQFLKNKITEKPLLKLPYFKHPLQVKCDSSGVAIRAVLSQEDMPIMYFSEKQNDAK